MKFKKYPRHQKKTITPMVLSHARRAVDREIENFSLFPELARWKTPEQRIADMDARNNDYFQNLRNHQAMNWKTARRELRALPEIARTGVLKIWDNGVYPREPVYLIQLISELKKTGISPWQKLRELRQLYLIGAGKLNANVVFRKPETSV